VTFPSPWGEESSLKRTEQKRIKECNGKANIYVEEIGSHNKPAEKKVEFISFEFVQRLT